MIECGLAAIKLSSVSSLSGFFIWVPSQNAAKSPSPSLARHPETLADLARTPAVSGGFCAALPVGSFKLLSSRKLKPAYQAVFVERDVRLRHGTGGSWVQADRGAMASQGVFLPGDKRDAYLAGEPADDTRFVAAFAHSLEHSGGYTPEEAQRVAKTLLPDIMHYDHTRPASYPDNGRTLTDRALDYFLGKSRGKLTLAAALLTR